MALKRVKITIYFVFLFLNFFIKTEAQTVYPSDIQGLSIWLSADSAVNLNGNNIEWDDLSGNNNNAIQTDLAKHPELILGSALLNNKPILQFDGVDDFMETTSLRTGTSFTGFIIINPTSVTNSPYPIILNKGAINTEWLLFFSQGPELVWRCFGSYDISTTLNPIKPYIVNFNVDNNLSKLLIDTVFINQRWTDVQPNYFTPLYIGNGSSNFFQGGIAEIIIYDRLLATQERKQIEGYLREKYTPPVDLGPNIVVNSFCDTVIRASNRFTNYLWSTGEVSDSIIINKAGKYWVNTIDVFGFQSSDTIEVSYNYSINQAKDTTLCSGQDFSWDTNLDKLNFSFDWSDSSNDSMLNISQAGQYWVKVTDSFGCLAYSDTINVVIDNIQQAISLGPDTSVCQGNEIKLSQGATQVQNYLWLDNSLGSSLQIDTAGQYWVTVTSFNGCTASDTINVAIAGVAPDVLFDHNNVCFGDSMYFYDLSVPPTAETIVQWEWDFGDGNLSSDINPVHFYNTQGDYIVKLTATTSVGCKDTYQQTVTVHYLPVVGFSTPLECSGKDLQFTDTSSVINNSVNQWKWSFGDAPSGTNNFSVSQNPTHEYEFPGVYNVKLIATTAFGCVDSLIKPLTINESPVADFTFQPVCFGVPVEFINNSSITSPLTISSYNWDFGTNSSSNPEPSFLYSSAGIHNVSLTVSASNGCESKAQKAIEVFHKPTAWFEPVDVCVGEVTEFNDLSIIGDSSINSWNWNFNDVETYTNQNPIMSFDETDVYFVSLKVNTVNGCMDSVVRVVKIHPLPIPLFTIEPQVVVPGQPMTINDLSNNTQNYSWDFGDGTYSNLAEPDHTYISEGKYDIVLNAESEFGCKESFSRTLNVITANLDIAVTNIFVINNENYLNITAELTNYGTVAVHEIDMVLEQKDGRRIKESWTGDFHSGKKLLYEFNAEIIPLRENIHDYVCVLSLNPNKSTDSDPINNEYCRLLGDNSLVLMDPFPNPVTNQLTIRFFLPTNENIKIEILNHEGKLINDNFPVKGEKGINTINFDALYLQDGIYAIKLEFGGKVYIRRFIKVKN